MRWLHVGLIEDVLIPKSKFWFRGDYGMITDSLDNITEWKSKDSFPFVIEVPSGYISPVKTLNTEMNNKTGSLGNGLNTALTANFEHGTFNLNNFTLLTVFQPTGISAKGYQGGSLLIGQNFIQHYATKTPNGVVSNFNVNALDSGPILVTEYEPIVIITTYNKTAGQSTAYINNNSGIVKSGWSGLINPSTFYIQNYANYGNLKGFLMESRLWEVELTPAEVNAVLSDLENYYSITF